MILSLREKIQSLLFSDPLINSLKQAGKGEGGRRAMGGQRIPEFSDGGDCE